VSEDDAGETPRGRARARETGAELGALREMHVSAIVNLMGRGEWATNAHVAYADKNKLSPATVAHYAGEASRRLRAMEQLDAPTLRRMLVARVEGYEKAAAEHKDPVICPECGFEVEGAHRPDAQLLKAAIAGALGIARIEGLEKTQQQLGEEYAASIIRALFEDFAAGLTADEYEKVRGIAERTRLVKPTNQRAVNVTVETTTHVPTTK